MRRARARGVRFEAPAKGAALGSPRAGQTTRATVGGAAGRAAPALVTAILALAGATRVVQAPDLEAPLYLGLVLLGQAAGLGLSVTLDRPGARAYWQLALLATLVLMPIAAMQAAASRYPFVAISHGSAGPLLWLTLATLVALGAFWLFACYHSSAQPEESGLLFLLAALLVPAMLGAPGTIDERSVLAMLALAAGLAGSPSSSPCFRRRAGARPRAA